MQTHIKMMVHFSGVIFHDLKSETGTTTNKGGIRKQIESILKAINGVLEERLRSRFKDFKLEQHQH